MTIGHFTSGVAAATGSCTAGDSAITGQSRLVTAPTDAWVGVKWDTDGKVYEYAANIQGYGADNGQLWIGSCANGKYEYRFVLISGDPVDVASVTVGVWTDASVTDLSVENRALGTGTTTFSVVQFELRIKAGQFVILQDQFFLDAEAEDPFPK